MMGHEDIKTLGFKDMHSEQMQALLEFISIALHSAEDNEFEDVLKAAEEVVILFGGVGINVEYSVGY